MSSLRGSNDARGSRPFYLVQRLYESPYRRDKPGSALSTKKGSNPFGGGRMGDYQLDYMGSAEFEFGAVPEAGQRLAKAGKGLVLAEHNYGGHLLDFLYIAKEGEPFDAFADWAEGREYDEHTKKWYDVRPFDGKEPPYELRQRLNGEDPPKYRDGKWHDALWWALRGNVVFGFHEDGHMEKWLASMLVAPTEFIR